MADVADACEPAAAMARAHVRVQSAVYGKLCVRGHSKCHAFAHARLHAACTGSGFAICKPRPPRPVYDGCACLPGGT